METMVYTKSETTENGESKLSKVLYFSNGRTIEFPLNPDGSVQWFDDTKLLKK